MKSIENSQKQEKKNSKSKLISLLILIGGLFLVFLFVLVPKMNSLDDAEILSIEYGAAEMVYMEEGVAESEGSANITATLADSVSSMTTIFIVTVIITTFIPTIFKMLKV